MKVTTASDIDPELQLQFVPMKEMYLGVRVAKHLCCQEIRNDSSKINDFLFRCRSFLITLAKEIRARLPFDQEVFQLLEFLNSKVATGG